jgi:diaminopimelate decarboxylase
MIDGGLADNPRPALYGARYSALPVQAPLRPNLDPVWFAGPFCESGDILIYGLPMPDVAAGELVAVPIAGAYQLAMGSNYNGACKPAVLWLHNGAAHLIQRRENVADLVARDLPLPTF